MNDTAPAVVVPRLTTERLRLREYRQSDFDAYAENLSDPITRAHLGVLDRRQAWRMFAAQTGSWMLQGSGWWTMERRDTGEVVGNVGVFFREVGADLEVGWGVHRRSWRQGYAKEAAAAAIAWGQATHGRARVIAHIMTTNVPSVRLATRLGMRFEKEVDFYGERVGLHALGP